MPLDRRSHRVAGHQPQQLTARGLARRGHLVVGEVSAARAQVRDQARDYGPRVRQRGTNAFEKRLVVYLATARLLQQARRYCQ
jgi:hypothetical protein